MTDTPLREGLDRAAALRVPPHSVEAEQSVLGGLLLDNDSLDAVSSILVADDFYRHDHRLIFGSMLELAEQNKPVDAITVSEVLAGRRQLDDAGGLRYLMELYDNTPTASNVRAYAEIVLERSTIRRLISTAHEIADSGYNPQGRDSATLIDEAESRVFRIADERPSRGGPESVKPLLTRVVERIDRLFETKGALTGLSTGFRDLDEITSGLQDSELIVIAGRPSMGKSSLAMNIAENVLMNGEGSVLVFSMEMPAESIMLRMLSSLGEIDQRKIRTGQLQDDDWPRLTSAVTMLNDKPMWIDDTAALTPNDIRSRARRIAREHGHIGLIVVDYIQLMRVAGTPENRTGEISEISRSLKAIAKEFGCPVIALSQLNRSLEARTDKRPIMSDLRESGAIEQDADVIMAIYRDEVYHEDTTDRFAEIIILKQRNGPIGTKRLTFQGVYTRFADYTSGAGYEEYL